MSRSVEVSKAKNGPVYVRPYEMWRSGPQLLADKVNFEKSLSELPGEGRTYSSKEEGSKVWQNKSRRKYYEVIPKPPKENRKKDLKAIENKKDSIRSQNSVFLVTDDEKIEDALQELDNIFLESEPKQLIGLTNSPSYSYIPTVRDVGIQCNRKKTNRHLLPNNTNDYSFRVIKSSNDGSVTAYSDVPQLKSVKPTRRTPQSKHEVWDERIIPQSEAIYSQIDRTKKKSFKGDVIRGNYGDVNDNYPTIIYRTPVNERGSPVPQNGFRPPSRYSESGKSSTNKTIKNKTSGFGFRLSSGVDGPNVDLPKHSPKLRSRSLNRSYEEPTNKWNNSLPRNPKKEVKEEVLEETISISNASSDDLHNYQNTNIDEFLTPKQGFRELEHKRKDISYVNTLPNQRSVKSGTANGDLWLRDGSVDSDYRRGLAQNEITYPMASPYSTISRIEKKNSRDSKGTDSDSLPPRQAYTLDKRLLKERQKQKERQTVSFSNQKDRENTNGKLYKSTADLTEHSRNDRDDDLRGGLAAAYKNRQNHRASSLSRMTAIKEGRVSPSQSKPRTYLSHSNLNSAGNSAHSSSDSDTLNRQKRQTQYIHDREPIVMYIPAVSHHNKRAEDEPDRLSGILRPSSVTSGRHKKPPKTSASSDITPTKPRDYSTKYSNYGTHGSVHEEERDQIVELKDTKNFGKNKKGSKSLNRRHSIPKDTKFPWLQKLKFKVRSKE